MTKEIFGDPRHFGDSDPANMLDIKLTPIVSKDGMEQSTRAVMVHSFLPARSSYLRFTCVDRSVNENNPTNYIIFFGIIF